MSMVKQGYQPVYRQKSYEFAGLSADNAGRPSQKVIIIDGKGKVWTAFYFFEQQPNGSWRIGGCVLVDPEGADA